MVSKVAVNDANAMFLRRILFALVGLTMLTGVLAAITTVQAMNANQTAVLVDVESFLNKN